MASDQHRCAENKSRAPALAERSDTAGELKSIHAAASAKRKLKARKIFQALERILYLWAIRHPACGYVQGINDLATPFFEVFLSAYITLPAHLFDPSLLPPSILSALEADTFWCLSKLLDGIQDNYVFAQPGIQRQVRRLGELVARIDAPLHAHLNSEGVEYMQFAFRWMNCLLMREMSVQSIIRLWDTYLVSD